MAQIGASADWAITLHKVLDYDEYVFELEEYRRGPNVFLVAHICFYHFSPSVFKRVLREWKLFRKVVTAPLYAVCDDGDFDKWLHFITRLGFKPTPISLPCNNGAIRQIFIHTVPDEQ